MGAFGSPIMRGIIMKHMNELALELGRVRRSPATGRTVRAGAVGFCGV